MIDSGKVKWLASEIVRGMTNGKLTEQQAEMLLNVTENILTTQLIHRADKNEYEIWSEGYCANETEGKWTRDVYLGTAWGVSFEDACIWLLKYHKHFDAKTMTYWGCRLYGKEKGAQTNW